MNDDERKLAQLSLLAQLHREGALTDVQFEREKTKLGFPTDPPDRDAVDQLSRIAQLHREGALTDGQFQRAKAELGFGSGGLKKLAVAGGLLALLLAITKK